MAYDLVIKNGILIDGTGLPRYRADVGALPGQLLRGPLGRRP
jgi:N-acyl-D-aspartate/D-glutamate deacylase